MDLLMLLPLLTVAGNAPCGPVPAFVEAFNDRDVPAMLAYLDPDAGWHYLGDGQLATEARGHQAIRSSMEGYFAAHPDTVSSIGPCQRNGPFISTVETATWGPDGERRQQRAMAVYRVVDGRIREVYYFPAVSDPAE